METADLASQALNSSRSALEQRGATQMSRMRPRTMLPVLNPHVASQSRGTMESASLLLPRTKLSVLVNLHHQPSAQERAKRPFRPQVPNVVRQQHQELPKALTRRQLPKPTFHKRPHRKLPPPRLHIPPPPLLPKVQQRLFDHKLRLLNRRNALPLKLRLQESLRRPFMKKKPWNPMVTPLKPPHPRQRHLPAQLFVTQLHSGPHRSGNVELRARMERAAVRS